MLEQIGPLSHPRVLFKQLDTGAAGGGQREGGKKVSLLAQYEVSTHLRRPQIAHVDWCMALCG